ncbi:hypothetical protein NVP2117O_17 [Vibrio phage 2.117.O._10N.261.45.E9]|nr:hypothetical protein NVP1117O_17 [Vibrio phage 1.117.O._10N.261.45.E9]AUR95418.1 hypothetical protein NVP1207B_11 [Vibrio phage 1.207.B._10N.222.51.C2]AUS02309.1 hypothetical protein NVP2117O_17 [Vibrio phage 2.117.O._10N.261.45.E9]
MQPAGFYRDAKHMIPLGEVSHVEFDQRPDYLNHATIVLTTTTWNADLDCYNNAPYLDGAALEDFMAQYQEYVRIRDAFYFSSPEQ